MTIEKTAEQVAQEVTDSMSQFLGDDAPKVEDKQTQQPPTDTKQPEQDAPKKPTQRELDHARAIEKGWNPNQAEFEEETGKEWVSASAYLRQRDMADEISRSHKQTKELRKQLEKLQKQQQELMQGMTKKQIESEKALLDDQILKAAQEQDYDSMRELMAKRDAIKQDQQEQQDDDGQSSNPYEETAEEIAQAATAWKEQNKWFANEKYRDEAIELEQRYAAANRGCSINESLDYVRTVMEKRHPELKPAPSLKTPLKQPDALPRGGGKKEFTESDLPSEMKAEYQRLVKHGHIKTAEQKAAYLKEAKASLGV